MLYLDFSVSNSTSKPINQPPKPTTNPCTGECVREEYEQEIYYNLFRDISIFQGKLEPKDQLLHEYYKRGRDSSSFLYFYVKRDKDYKNLQLASKGYENLMRQKKFLPPYGSVREILFDKLPCLQEFFQNFRKNESDTKSPIPSINFNLTLTETIKKAITALEPKIDKLEIETLLRFAVSMKDTHLINCSSEKDEICSVAALYDMLTIRTQLQEKNTEIQTLSSKQVKILISLFELFLRKDGTLYQLFNQRKIDDRNLLKEMMEQYINQIALCLNETARIYERLLRSGQPTMKTAKLYESFLEELSNVNETIYNTCNGGASVLDYLYNFTNRQELAAKIINLMSISESGTTKKFLYSRIVVELVENMDKKLNSFEYNYGNLNDSLLHVDRMNNLLKKYLTQSVENLFKKTDLYKELKDLNDPFQSGILVSNKQNSSFTLLVYGRGHCRCVVRIVINRGKSLNIVQN